MKILKPQQEYDFHNAVFCRISRKPFLPSDFEVKDYFHKSGLYREPTLQRQLCQ